MKSLAELLALTLATLVMLALVGMFGAFLYYSVPALIAFDWTWHAVGLFGITTGVSLIPIALIALVAWRGWAD